MTLLLIILALLSPGLVEAATRTVTWDVYTEDANFKEIRVFRGPAQGVAQAA